MLSLLTIVPSISNKFFDLKYFLPLFSRPPFIPLKDTKLNHPLILHSLRKTLESNRYTQGILKFSTNGSPLVVEITHTDTGDTFLVDVIPGIESYKIHLTVRTFFKAWALVNLANPNRLRFSTDNAGVGHNPRTFPIHSFPGILNDLEKVLLKLSIQKHSDTEPR